MAEFRPVLFKVGDDSYGVDIALVRGIENLLPIVSVPNSARHVKGIINLRGEIIPVFSMRSKFGLVEVEPTEETKLIIVQNERFQIALEVDMVEEIHAIEAEKIHKAPVIIKNKDTRYVQELVSCQGGLAIIIDVENILTDEEKDEISKMISQ